MARKIIAATIGYTDSTGAKTLYVATEGFVTGSGDTPADTWFQGRLSGDISYRWRVAAPFTGTKPVAGIGVLTLNNNDGGMDAADQWVMRDGAVTIKMLDVDQNWDAGTVIATTIVETASFNGLQSLRIVLRDPTAILEAPLQTDSYTSGDSTGQKKPISHGTPYSVSPLLTDTATDAYDIHDSTFTGITQVMDNGASVAFSKTTNGFTLSATASGKVTADVNASASTFTNFISSITGRISGLTVNSASQTTINDLGYTYSYYVGDNKSAADVLFDGCASHTGWYFINRAGELAFGRLQAPAASGVVDFTDAELIDVSAADTDNAKGLSNRMGAIKNWTPLALESIDATLAEDVRQKLARDYQHEVTSTNSLETNYAHADGGPLLPTYFTDSTDADTEIDRLTALYASKRKIYTIDVAFDLDKFNSIELGDTVSVTYGRMGLGSLWFALGFDEGFARIGADEYLLLGIEGNFTQNKMRLEIWG